MRKSSLSVIATLIFLIAPVAPVKGVMLSPSGTGQALIFPYFTVASSSATPGSRYTTLISIVNTTDRGKALRVQFHEGKRAAIVHELNLFLAAGDVWTAALSPDAQGRTMLATQDRSCRLPVSSAPFSFDPLDWAPNGVPAPGEGYFVVLEMGTAASRSALEDAITHVIGEPPCNLPADAQIAAQLEAPSGGFHGSATILNVLEGTAYSYDAVALEEWRDSPLYGPPGSTSVSLFSASPPSSTVIDGSIAYRSSWTTGADAVSAALMVAQLEFEYTVELAIAGSTDVAMTFPTKTHYAAQTAATAPFSAVWSASGACEQADEITFDRERRVVGTISGYPEPPPTPRASLCWTTNVHSLASGRPVLGTSIPMSYCTIFGNGPCGPGLPRFVGFSNGVEQFHFVAGRYSNLPAPPTRKLVAPGNTLLTDLRTGTTSPRTGVIYEGLPVTAVSFVRYLNGTLQDGGGNRLLSSYGTSSVPKMTRRIIVP